MLKLSRKELKEKAKEQLGGSIFSQNWLYAVLAVVVYMVIISVVGAIPGVGSAIIIIFSGALEFGLVYVFLKQARDGEKIEIGNLFKGFTEDFKGNFILGLLITIFVSLWSLLFIIPGIVKAYAYSMSFYIKNDHPEFNWKNCIDESQRIMNGHKMELFVLQLSFIGWAIVGALCLGVGTFWVQAYMNATMVQFYESIKDDGVAEVAVE